LKDRDVKYENFRAEGPGQHVNKAETAVRAIHIPTGIAAVARDSKPQLQNKIINSIKKRNDECNYSNAKRKLVKTSRVRKGEYYPNF
jgi:protein subunit release factor B